MAGDRSLGFSVTALDRASQTFIKLAATVERLEKKLDALDRKSVTVTVDANTAPAERKIDTLDKSFGAATIRVAALGRAMGSLSLPGAIIAATPAIASLGSSALTASGALWLLPAAAAAGGIAAGTLATGFAHVSDALGPTGTPAQIKKVNEALAALSPAARSTVETIRGLGPAWSSLRLDVQEKLFAGMAQTVSGLAKTYLPMLQTGMGGTAVALNQFAVRFAAFARAPQTLADVPVLFTNVNAAIAALAPVVNNLFGAFRDIAVVGSTFLPGLASGAVDATQKFQTFVHTARETGQLKVWIQQGLDTIAQLGRIAGNVGSILKSVFDGAASSGGSFLSTLELITNRIATGLKTPAGAGALQDFFGTVRTLVGLLWDKLVQLWPVVVAGAGAFAALLVAAAPLSSTIFGLVVQGLVPLLDAIKFMAPVLGPAVIIFGLLRGAMVLTTAAMTAYRIATGIATAVSVAWQLGMGTALVLTKAQSVALAQNAAAARIAGAAAAVWSGAQWLVTAALNGTLFPLLAQKAAMIATATWGAVVAGASKAWAAAQWLLNIALSANPIALVVIAIAALVAGLIWAWNSSETFRAVVIGVWTAIKTAAVAVFNFLAGFITGTWNNIKTAAITAWNVVSAFFAGAFAAFAAFFSAVWNGIVSVFSAVWGVIRDIALVVWNGIATALGSAFNIFMLVFIVVWGAIAAAFLFVWDSIRNTALTVWGAISSFFQGAFAVFQAVFAVVWNAVSAVFTSVWNFIRNTATTIWNSISAYFQAAFAVYQAFFATVWNAISAVFSSVWNFIRNTAVTVWNAIVAFFTPAFQAFSAFFSTVWNAISLVFTTVWNFIRNTAVTVWTAISGFFTAAFAVFSAFFSTVWNGIWNFFVGIWNSLRDTAINAWNIIYAFFQGVLAVFTKFWADTWNNIVGAFDRIWSGVKDIATRVWEGVKGAFVGAINWIIDKINFFAGAINKVAGMLGFNINLHVDRLAMGGEVEAVRRAFGGTIEAKQVIHRATGGGVDATGGGRLPYTGTRRDTLPALAGGRRYALQGEEWIIRRDSSRTIGQAGMAAINNADRAPVDIVPRGQMQRMALYADGGALEPTPMASAGQIARAASALVPGSRMSSGYRRGDTGYHGKNQAADMTGNLGAINRAWAQRYGASTNQLIYTPGINLLDGRPHRYNAATQADHYDHVHIAVAGLIGGGNFDPSAGGGISQMFLRPIVDGLIGPLKAILVPIRDNPGESYGKRFGAGLGIKILDNLFSKADAADAAAASSGGMDVSGITGPVVEQVRQVANRYGWGAGPQWDAIRALVQKESGWNPNAANPTSSARGLFQKMTSIHGPVEPTAAGQAAWGLNYIRGRYGDPVRAWAFHRANNYYDDGGVASGRGFMFKDVITPERVLSGRQTVAFEQLVAALSSGRPQAMVANGAAAARLAAARDTGRAASAVTVTADNSATVAAVKRLQTEVQALQTVIREARPVQVFARNDDVTETGRAVALQLRL